MRALPESIRRYIAARLVVPQGQPVAGLFAAAQWALHVSLSVLDHDGQGPVKDQDRGKLWAVSVTFEGVPAWWSDTVEDRTFEVIDQSGRAVHWPFDRCLNFVRGLLVNYSPLSACALHLNVDRGQLMAGRWSVSRRETVEAADALVTVQALEAQSALLTDQAGPMALASARRADYMRRAANVAAFAAALPSIRDAGAGAGAPAPGPAPAPAPGPAPTPAPWQPGEQ